MLQERVALAPDAAGCSCNAFGVFALADIEENGMLCKIPKAAVLSVRNTEISDIIEEEQLGGGLGLIAGVPQPVPLLQLHQRWSIATVIFCNY